MKKFYSLMFVTLTVSTTLLQGCATMGSSFDFQGPGSVVVGKTTQAEIVSRYGNPFRVGFENGNKKWTYGYYQYKLFGDSQTKDLSITFDKNGVVASYTYSSSEPEEVTEALH